MEATNNELICSVCYKEFNHSARVPRNIPICGHSFCSPCIEKLLQHGQCNINPSKKEISCPFDRQKFMATSLDAFPINIPLKQILERKFSQEVFTISLANHDLNSEFLIRGKQKSE